MSEELPREQSSPKRQGRRSRLGGPVGEFVITLVIAFVLVFGFVRPFVVEAYRIPSASMEPTLDIHDRVLANKFIYDFTDPQRGQIVIFKNPEDPNSDPLIKRVVGLPGDTLRIQHGKLYVNGVPQNEPYIHKNPCLQFRPKTCSFGPTEVPPGHVFVMGDNRANSYDSRFFGPVPESSIEGEAFLRFWPPGRLAWL